MTSVNEVLIFLLTLLAFISVCVALYYFWRQVFAVVIILTLLIALVVGGLLAFGYCSGRDCSPIGKWIVAFALGAVLLRALELWDGKRSLERQVREGDRSFREANPGNTGPWYLLTGGFQYSWDEQTKKVLRQEISEEDRKRIEHTKQIGATASQRWVDKDGNSFIEYGERDKDGNFHVKETGPIVKRASAEEGKS
jgi:hypothetical protein